MGYGGKEIQEEDNARVARESSSDYNGGWGAAYAEIHRMNRAKEVEKPQTIPPHCNEYMLMKDITSLTLENIRLRNANTELECEVGRLTRTIERMKLDQ